MSLCLNDAELSALNGLSSFCIVLYVMGIRRYMDYETRMVGAGSGKYRRLISWQALRESLYIEPIKGSQINGSPHKSAVRRAALQLKKAGLISIISKEKQLVFECLLANRGKSAQIKADSCPTHPTDTKADILSFPKNAVNSENNNLNEEKADTKADIPKNCLADIQQITDIKKKTITNVIVKKERRARQMPDDFCVIDQHREIALQNNWPTPDKEFAAFKDYHLSKGTRFIDWDRAFYTWLRNAKKFNVRNGGHDGNGNQQLTRSERAKLTTLSVCQEIERRNHRNSELG